MPKVSVIMPSLNVAPYIEKCISSVVNQTMKDIEILCIDAGSTDGTLEILQRYAQQDARIQLIHSDRKSYGYQVNMGIQMARGDYVSIIDTDDYIAPEMYEELYSAAMQYDADYVKGNAFIFYESIAGETLTQKRVLGPADREKECFIAPRLYPQLLMNDNFLWNGIYKSDFIKKIRLNETPGAAYQDLGFIVQAYSRADKAVYLNKGYYYYRTDNPGASGNNKKAFDFLINEYTYAQTFMKGLSIQWESAFYEKMFLHMDYHFYKMAQSGTFWEQSKESIQQLYKWIETAVRQGILLPKHVSDVIWDRIGLFLEDEMALYEGYQRDLSEQKKVWKALQSFMQCQEDIVLFGTGGMGYNAYNLFRYYGKKIVALCDNNKITQTNGIEWAVEMSVLSPEETVRRYPNAGYVIANKKNRKEMEEQLLAAGIKQEKLFGYTISIDIGVIAC